LKALLTLSDLEKNDSFSMVIGHGIHNVGEPWGERASVINGLSLASTIQTMIAIF
jgi:hypothetical protein